MFNSSKRLLSFCTVLRILNAQILYTYPYKQRFLPFLSFFFANCYHLPPKTAVLNAFFSLVVKLTFISSFFFLSSSCFPQALMFAKKISFKKRPNSNSKKIVFLTTIQKNFTKNKSFYDTLLSCHRIKYLFHPVFFKKRYKKRYFFPLF